MLILANKNSQRERRLEELNEKQKKEEREKIEADNKIKLKLTMQLEEQKRSHAIREAELKAELELERQLREWEREQPQLPSVSQTRTQPVMAKDYDVLKRDGDSQETSASPPRANISVFPPVMAQTTNYDSKAISTEQTDTCLRQSANNLTTPLSTITKSPVTSRHTEPSCRRNSNRSSCHTTSHNNQVHRSSQHSYNTHTPTQR